MDDECICYNECTRECLERQVELYQKRVAELEAQLREQTKIDEVPHQGPSRRTIPRWLAEEAYGAYSAKFGRYQTLEQILKRCGFHDSELDKFVPGWRERVEVAAELRKRLEELEKERDELSSGYTAGYAACEADVAAYGSTYTSNAVANFVADLERGEHRDAAKRGPERRSLSVTAAIETAKLVFSNIEKDDREFLAHTEGESDEADQ